MSDPIVCSSDLDPAFRSWRRSRASSAGS